MNVPPEMRLNLLLFAIEQVHFAIDADQVAAVNTYAGEQQDDLFWFHEVLGYGDKPVVYSAPVIVTIRTEHERTYRVIIDSMEDIAEFSHSSLRLFPPLLEPFALRSGMWGVLPRDGEMILLVDFKRLLKQRVSAVTAARNLKCEGDLA